MNHLICFTEYGCHPGWDNHSFLAQEESPHIFVRQPEPNAWLDHPNRVVFARRFPGYLFHWQAGRLFYGYEGKSPTTVPFGPCGMGTALQREPIAGALSE